MLYTIDPLQMKDTQTESKKKKKEISCKWKQKNSWGSREGYNKKQRNISL